MNVARLAAVPLILLASCGQLPATAAGTREGDGGAGGATSGAGGAGGQLSDCRTPAGDQGIFPGAWFSAAIDMGDVAVGAAQVTERVTLANLGTGPVSLPDSALDLDPFTASLACSGGPCPGQELLPGRVLDIDFAFAPPFGGTFTRAAEFTTSCGLIHVDLTGRGVAPSFSCTPTDVLDFGVVVQGTSLTKKITCTNVSSLDSVLVVRTTRDPTGQFSVFLPTFDGKILVNHGSSVDIGVTFSAAPVSSSPDVGERDFSTTVEADYDSGAPVFVTPVKAIVASNALAVEGQRPGASGGFDFGCVAPGAVGRMELWLINEGRAPLSVQGLWTSSLGGEFGLTAPPTPFVIPGFSEDNPGLHQLTIELTFSPPVGDDGVKTGELSVTNDGPGESLPMFVTGVTGACR